MPEGLTPDMEDKIMAEFEANRSKGHFDWEFIQLADFLDQHYPDMDPNIRMHLMNKVIPHMG
jgi:hypothetical protein